MLTFEQMKNIDLLTVDHDTLVDANDVNVDIELPKMERMTEVLKQMGGCLYCFRSGKTAVKVVYSKTTAATVDDRLMEWFQML